MKYHAILVLSDGETWETLGDQTIRLITDDQFETICMESEFLRDIKPVLEFKISQNTP
jgi:hypothetical protein